MQTPATATAGEATLLDSEEDVCQVELLPLHLFLLILLICLQVAEAIEEAVVELDQEGEEGAGGKSSGSNESTQVVTFSPYTESL